MYVIIYAQATQRLDIRQSWKSMELKIEPQNSIAIINCNFLVF